MDTALHELGAARLAAGIARGAFSAVEVTDAFLARIAEVDPILNAVCTLDPSARRQAEDVDARRARGEPPRALEGVPFLAKDNLETAGLRTTYGSTLFEDNVPDEDAVCVARLRAAGAVLLGKSNTPELAADINTTNAVFGQTRNPWDVNTTSGGSSGGTGAAVAAALAPAGLGTDLGGSIRIPAAFNGICGLRPCPGRIPVYPQAFAWETLIPHVHGPLARCVADLALLMDALSGPDERDPLSLPVPEPGYAAAVAGSTGDLAGCRIAWVGDLDGLVPMEAEVVDCVRGAAVVLEGLGATVEDRVLDAAELRDIIKGTRAFNVLARMEPHYETNRDALTASIINQVEAAQQVAIRTVVEAERLRTRYWHRVRELMRDVDFLLLPTTGVPAFRLDAPLPEEVGGRPVASFYDAILSTYAFSVLGLPVLSLPAGFTAGGLPVGLQLVGHRFGEDALLRAGAVYERDRPELFNRIPAVDAQNLHPVHPRFSTGGVPVTSSR